MAGRLRRRQHQVSKKAAQALSDEIGTCTSVHHYPSEFEVLRLIQQPLPELPLYEESWRCIVNTGCPFITTKPERMKLYWRKQHEAYIEHSNSGGSEVRTSQIREGARKLQCQRLFAQGPHSQYIEVQRPEEARGEGVGTGVGAEVFVLGHDAGEAERHHPGRGDGRGEPVVEADGLGGVSSGLRDSSDADMGVIGCREGDGAQTGGGVLDKAEVWPTRDGRQDLPFYTDCASTPLDNAFGAPPLSNPCMQARVTHRLHQHRLRVSMAPKRPAMCPERLPSTYSCSWRRKSK